LNEIISALTTISLLDSASMITVATVPMIMLLSSQRPLQAAFAFIAGTFITYFALSVLVFLGLDSLVDAAEVRFEEWKNSPRTVCLYVQIAIGLFLLGTAIAMMNPSKKPPERQPGSVSPSSVFIFAATLIAVGLPGAIPLFAAIDVMLRADVRDATAVWLLLYYNIVFVLPLVALVIIRAALGDRSTPVFEAISNFLSAWGKRIVIVVLLLLGMALVADGIGWLLGRSFIPIG
jgi:cytochrome c biogenesis protein CcdA